MLDLEDEVLLSGWSKGYASRRDAERDQAISFDSPLPVFDSSARFHRARITTQKDGQLVLEITAPRPTRIWIDGTLALDESLWWRSFEREFRATVVWPLSAGETALIVEQGDLPCHPEYVDRFSESRNRARVVDALAQRSDGPELVASFVPGFHGPAGAFRHLPTQFWRDDRLWQHVIVTVSNDRPGQDAPSTDVPTSQDGLPQHVNMRTPFGSGQLVKDGLTNPSRQRWHVPVATAATIASPARETGVIDPRVEPSCLIVAAVDLAVEAPGGEVIIKLPVFETRGRLSPRKEYRESRWPSVEVMLAEAPKPILPKALAHYGDLYWAAWKMLLDLARPGLATAGSPSGYVSTGSAFTNYQFVWDTAFAAMATSYGARFFPIHDSLDFLYSRQFDGGYLHREHDIRDGMPVMFEPDFSPNPPLLAVAEWHIAQVTGDRVRLSMTYPALTALHRWIDTNRKLPDGTFWTTGLANGLDNSPSLGDGYPDLTAQMAHDAEMLANIAEAIGKHDEAAEWRTKRNVIGQALNDRLWDPVQNIYSTSLPNGGHNPNKVVTAFWPLWAGLVPPDRIEHLARHLQDPASFWRTHPIPSLAADSEHFLPEGRYWRGSTWAPTNYAAISGFARAGREDLARMTTLRHLDQMSKVYVDTGKIWENYSCEETRPGSVSMPDYCWSALGPIALLIEQVIGVHLDAMNDVVKWSVPSAQIIGVSKLPFGAGCLSLLQRQNFEGNWLIEVTTDRSFTLVLQHEGQMERRLKILPGTSEWPLQTLLG